MDLYTVSVIVGGVGLAGMAATGLGRHGSGHGGSHATAHGHGTATPGHAAGHGHAAWSVHGHGGVAGAASQAATWMLMSPRFLFAGLVGFGVTGVLLRSVIGGPVLLLAAIAGGIAVERLLVAPLWNFALRFASNPAMTLDSSITSEAVAVTNFDRNGQGIIAVEVDGQVQQVLATLLPADRAAGAVVRAGQRVRIEEVDGARHRCSVSLL